MNKKAVWGALAAAIALALAYGGSTWWAGAQIQSRYDAALAALPQQSAMVRVVERDYRRGFFGALSSVTLEIGCAAPSARPPADATDAAPPAPVRVTLRHTIHHGPLVGTTLAAATIDSELRLDAGTQAEAVALFGTPTPLTAHTRVAFDGAFTSELSVKPAGRSEGDTQGKGRLSWQGAQLRVASNAAQTQARYELTMPGLDFRDARTGTSVQLGALRASADMDLSAGWMLATGKTQGRLDRLSIEMPPAQGGTKGPALPALLLQNVELEGDASIQDGLYASGGSLQGSGRIGDTPIDGFELRSSARRIQVEGYRKLVDGWTRSDLANGCGQPGNAAGQAALKALLDQWAPELKAMARYGPEFSLDTLQVDIGGRRGEVHYTVRLAGVNDQDLQGPGTALLRQRGVLKAGARLPVAWLETLAGTGALSGRTPPPQAVAKALAQAEGMGFVRREGEDLVGEVEYNAGRWSLNGKPMGPVGGIGAPGR